MKELPFFGSFSWDGCSWDRMREFLSDRPVLTGVALVTVASLGARLIDLGRRTMHFDEARVGFRILEYAASGQWMYDATVHGPFLFHIDRVLFALLGPSDFVARLPVALIGGLLPATAWLLRKRLNDVEIVALAALLAANPIVLYYSRFMRNDVLVAAFAFAAFGFAVRLADTQRPRYLYAATISLALAATTKENALLYIGIWVGAIALTIDYRLFTARASNTKSTTVGRTLLRQGKQTITRWWHHLGLALGAGLLVIVFFYAPRPDLYQSLSNPTALPAVIGEATLGTWNEFISTWGGSSQDHPYLPYLEDYLRTLRVGGLVVSGLGVVGFLADRYGGDHPRDVIAIAGYWAGASLLIYPLATDIQAPWTAVHTIVPLAVPAAAGVGRLVETGRSAFRDGDRLATALTAVIALAITAQLLVTAGGLVYQRPTTDTQLVQFGQPADDFAPALEVIEPIAEETSGTDVLFVGLKFNNDAGTLQFDRLPWPWYLEAMDASVSGSRTLDPLQTSDTPPVVIVPADAPYLTGYTESDAEPHLDEYTRIGEYALTLRIPGNVVYAVVYVRTAAMPTAV